MLATFDPDDWPADGANESERYVCAASLWKAAREAWADGARWAGDWSWWAESMRVAAETPDEPWYPETG